MNRRKKPNHKATGLFILISVVVLLGFIGLSLARGFSSSVRMYVVLGAAGALLSAFLTFELVTGPGKKSWKGWMGYLGLFICTAGLLGLLGSGLGSSLFGEHQEFTITEGGTTALPFGQGDSLYLYKYKPTLHAQSSSLKGYHAMVVTLIDSSYNLDTVSLNAPIEENGRRIHLTGYGMSKDSLYLLFKLAVPWGDTLSYEFPPQGVIDDPRFPLMLSFEKFHMDRSQLYPNPEVPVVTIKVMMPGELITTRKLRAPDSLEIQGYELFFDGVRMRPTVDFRSVWDRSWLGALCSAGLLLLGLGAMLLARASRGFGARDD